MSDGTSVEPDRPGGLSRAAIGIAAAGYFAVAAYDQWIRVAPFAQVATEWLAGGAMALAFVGSLRWPRRGAIAAIATVGAELVASVALEAGDQSVKVVIPVLIVASGLMLGARAALVAGWVFGGGAVALELVLSPSFGSWPLDKGRPLVVLALVSVAAVLLTRTAVRGQERALEASDRARRRFLDLFQNAPEGLLALGIDGRILEANGRAHALLGVADLPGRSLEAVLREIGARGPRPMVSGTSEDPARLEVGEAPRTRILEAVARRMDGSVSEGSAWLLVLLDTTERRALEAQLLHAQRLETVGLLAGGVAHDFNNLLTAIGGNAELLADTGSAEVRELAGEILDAQRRGTALTRQLLAFARRDVRKVERLDLAATVRGMERFLVRLLGERNRLELRTEGEVPVLMDRTQVEQVVVNLVTNARDASPADAPVRVEVRTERVPAEDGGGEGTRVAVLAVADLGQGMTPETRARIFEPFFTTKARGQGTGLGLSTVHGIVTQSGGGLAVDTAPGRGTAITVRLPLVVEAVVAEPAAATPRPEPVRGNDRVMVVEDDPGVRSLVVRTLRGAGYAVAGHASGREALDTLRAGAAAPGLLLTDLAMPEVDGAEVARRALAIHPDLPVLYMTGHFDEARIPAGHVLRKPFTPEELLRGVGEVLAGRGGPRPARVQPP